MSTTKENKKTLHSSLRIVGVEMPVRKNVHIALTSIYGIGLTTAIKICKALNINTSLRLRELDEETIARLNKYIEEDLANQGLLTEGNLKSQEREYRRRLMDIHSYRGRRLALGLPRNSRTKTNANTVRMLRKKMGDIAKRK